MKLFKKDRTQTEAPSTAVEPSPEPGRASGQRSSGKGRPTPKRREAQARGLRPVVPKDRKAAKREARARQDEAWERQRRAMITGDERYLPLRDKGPIKRYIRDYVDARYSVGELFLPAALVLLLVSMGLSFTSITSTSSALVTFYIMVAIYAVFLIAIVDAIVCWWLVRKRLYAKFGVQTVKDAGVIGWYVFSRCFNLRRWRQPSPQVARREYPS